jgi:hypothetical protein
MYMSVSFFLISWSGVRLSPLGTSTTNWPILPAPNDRWRMWSSRCNENWQRKPKYSEKTCPSATLSNTNPIWPDLGSSPCRRCGKPATNRLSYRAAVCVGYKDQSVRSNILSHVSDISHHSLCLRLPQRLVWMCISLWFPPISCWLLRLFFRPKEGGSMFLGSRWNSVRYTASHPGWCYILFVPFDLYWFSNYGFRFSEIPFQYIMYFFTFIRYYLKTSLISL